MTTVCAGFTLSIEGRLPSHAVDGYLTLSGWCFDEVTREPAAVRVDVSGKRHVSSTAVIVGEPHNSADFPVNARFHLDVPVPRGYHAVRVEASLGDSGWVLLKTLPLCGETAPLEAGIESPELQTVDEGLVRITGWALQPQERIRTLILNVGKAATTCRYGIARPDIAARFRKIAHAEHCGFECDAWLPAGPQKLVLTAHLDGAVVAARNSKDLYVNGRSETAFFKALDAARAPLLRIQQSTRPKVSIIIPVFGQTAVTLKCLKAIERHTRGLAYEVIVVDDNSDERTRLLLDQVRGIRLIHNDVNLGFVHSCNRGARAAEGEYLVFLNNDTEVTHGWLSAMLRVFDQRRDCGLVGAKLIYPDGRLQEAGGIIWSDASGINYGNGDDPDKPEYNYLRQVDYCSGACIATPRELFKQLGGFDERYVPAYYEDTDLAFRVREAGLAVYYQPAASIIHHEGQTSGRDTSTGVKRYQLVNQEKFFRKWQPQLATHLPRAQSNVTRARDRSLQRRALVVDARVLQPDRDSGSLRMWNLLRILQSFSFQPTFLPINRQRVSPYTERMQELGVECLYGPHAGELDEFFACRGAEFDLIILSRAGVAWSVLPLCRRHAPAVPVIFDTVDLHFLREQREAEIEARLTKRRQARVREATELRLVEQCDATVVVSPVEQALLREKCPGREIAVISNIHECSVGRIPRFEMRRDFLFVGGFEHTPNIDAMVWFCGEIMPRIVQELPEAKLHIVGSNMPASIRTLENEHVVTHGYVEDLVEFFDKCLLSVAPLRWGAGVKGKINQSMSHGVPVVATSVAAEGMYLVDDENVLLADDSPQFARQVVRLCRDPALWQRLSEQGQANVREHFSFDAAKRNLTALLDRMGLLCADHAGSVGNT